MVLMNLTAVPVLAEPAANTRSRTASPSSEGEDFGAIGEARASTATLDASRDIGDMHSDSRGGSQ